jgi:serine/threonine protein kinase
MSTSDSEKFEPPDSRVGKTLGGKWKLDRLIGIGGMASVYAASHRNGALAAIKVLRPEYARRAEARTRFLREAYIANNAGKGAVAVLDDDVDDDGSPYLVMELLRGEPVDRRVERLGGRLPLTEVMWIAEQTLLTLECAHDHGIIHRDLKPENLFWTSDDRIKVLDFGVARMRDAKQAETTRTGMILGTPAFMAPEQALGAMQDIDPRTDLWAVGAIMFTLLTGRDVHTADEGNPVVVAATRRAPPVAMFDSTLPEDVARIVDRALAFERDGRYPTARAMRDDIQRHTQRNAAEPTIPSVRFPPPPDVHAVARPTPFPAEEASSRGLATQMSDDDSLALGDVLRLLDKALRTRIEHGPARRRLPPRGGRTLEGAHRTLLEHPARGVRRSSARAALAGEPAAPAGTATHVCRRPTNARAPPRTEEA